MCSALTVLAVFDQLVKLHGPLDAMSAAARNLAHYSSVALTGALSLPELPSLGSPAYLGCPAGSWGSPAFPLSAANSLLPLITMPQRHRAMHPSPMTQPAKGLQFQQVMVSLPPAAFPPELLCRRLNRPPAWRAAAPGVTCRRSYRCHCRLLELAGAGSPRWRLSAGRCAQRLPCLRT